MATHYQYLAGYKAASTLSIRVCPTGHRNAAFCTGYEDNSGDVGDCSEDCPLEPPGLVGCPLDSMKHVAGFAPLVGTWHFVNRTGWGEHVVGTGTMTFDNGGNLTITYASKTPFGNWVHLASWGSDGHQITICSAFGGCYLQFVNVYDDHNHVTLSDSDYHSTQYLPRVGANNTNYNYGDFNETNSR